MWTSSPSPTRPSGSAPLTARAAVFAVAAVRRPPLMSRPLYARSLSAREPTQGQRAHPAVAAAVFQARTTASFRDSRPRARAVVVIANTATVLCSSPSPPSLRSVRASVVTAAWEPSAKRPKLLQPSSRLVRVDATQHCASLAWSAEDGRCSPQSQRSASSASAPSLSDSSLSPYAPVLPLARRLSDPCAGVPVLASAHRMLPMQQSSAPQPKRSLPLPTRGMGDLLTRLQQHPAIRNIQRLGDDESREDDGDIGDGTEDVYEDVTAGSTLHRPYDLHYGRSPDPHATAGFVGSQDPRALHERNHPSQCDSRPPMCTAAAPFTSHPPQARAALPSSSLGFSASSEATFCSFPPLPFQSAMAAAESSFPSWHEASPEPSRFLSPSALHDPSSGAVCPPWSLDASQWESSERPYAPYPWEEWLEVDCSAALRERIH